MNISHYIYNIRVFTGFQNFADVTKTVNFVFLIEFELVLETPPYLPLLN